MTMRGNRGGGWEGRGGREGHQIAMQVDQWEGQNKRRKVGQEESQTAAHVVLRKFQQSP